MPPSNSIPVIFYCYPFEICCLFSNEKLKGNGLIERVGGNELEEIEGREIYFSTMKMWKPHRYLKINTV